MKARLPALLFLFAAVLSAQEGSGFAVPLVLEEVIVIDMTGAAPLAGQTVVIERGRITRIGETSDISFPDGAKRVKAAGKYLIPGLWDMHVHVLSPGAPELAFPLLLANGVTGIRDMNGPLPLEEITKIKEEIASGKRLGPRIVAPGPLLDGPGRPASALGPGVVAVETESEAREAVSALRSRGADFIKVYNRLTPSLLQTISDEARKVGIHVAGHVPHLATAARVSDLGLKSMEHLQGILEAASSNAEQLQSVTGRLANEISQNGRPTRETIGELIKLRRALSDSYDPQKAASLIDRLVENQTWQCPTLTSNRALALAETEPGFATDPRLKYVPLSWRELWFKTRQHHSWEDPPTRYKRFGRQLEIVGTMHARGVRILAGTDLGVSHVYPGFSLHDELHHLVIAGLSPSEALQAATKNPAEFLNLDSLGTVEVGKVADLLLLDADPTATIANTRKIHAVIVAGRMLDRAFLDDLLKQGERTANDL